MTRDQSIIELGAWLRTAPGQQVLAWEQARLDQGVADSFGFHALQLGLSEMDGLRANRMPHRWVASDSLLVPAPVPAPMPADGLSVLPLGDSRVHLHCEFDALPFPAASVDLVVLPHALELALDPHQTLREVERILVPDGRVLIAGFNPASLWALRQRAGHGWRHLGLGRQRPMYLPRAGEFIGYWRLRDWLRLLGFEVEAGRFGCYAPPLHGERWLQRFEWMNRLGERWWPVLGAVYFVSAVKRVRGMRLVGMARHEKQSGRRTAAVVTQRQHRNIEQELG